MSHRPLILAAWLCLAALIPGTLLMACSPPASSIAKGKEIFTSEQCPTCHYFRGLGKEGGIDLSEVGRRRSKPWIIEHIENPKIHDPNIGMPSFAHLGKTKIGALAEFLTSEHSSDY